jgi:hypothetical protein
VSLIGKREAAGVAQHVRMSLEAKYALSLQLIGRFVDCSFRAGFIILACWRTGHADGADHLVADFDGQSAGVNRYKRRWSSPWHKPRWKPARRRATVSL